MDPSGATEQEIAHEILLRAKALTTCAQIGREAALSEIRSLAPAISDSTSSNKNVQLARFSAVILINQTEGTVVQAWAYLRAHAPDLATSSEMIAQIEQLRDTLLKICDLRRPGCGKTIEALMLLDDLVYT